MLLDDIEIFTVISETKSLSQAAERLYMSRPGLSQKIANIEARYGTKLYVRTSTGVVPTAAGQIVTKFAKKIATLETALSAELAAVDEHFDSTIEVGMSMNDGVALLPALVKRFHDLHPDALVHLDAGYEPELMEKLKSGKLDFALLENQPLDDGISRETLGLQAPAVLRARPAALQLRAPARENRDAARMAHDHLRVELGPPHGGQPPLPRTLQPVAHRP